MKRPVRMLALLALASAGLVRPAWSGVPLTVTRTDDPAPDGCAPADCSLREAIVDANAAAGMDTITLPAGTYTLAIPPDGSPDDGLDGDLDLFGEFTITGAGAPTTIIDAGGVDRVLTVHALATVTIEDLTIRGGSTADLNGGGGIENVAALTLRRVAVADNLATAGAGGGILNSSATSDLTVVDSTISGNRTIESSGNGGAMENRNGADAALTNVTISGNAANQAGGGINADGGSVTLQGVTITANQADADAGGSAGEGGGIRLSLSATVTMSNTILAGNFDTPSPFHDPDCAGTLTSAGNNLVQNHTSPNCTFVPAAGDLTGADPVLGPLADNGGPTVTHALPLGSPAIDAGGTCSPADQRGAPRAGVCDIGAYELNLCGGIVVNRVGTDGDDTIAGSEGADGVLALGGHDVVSVGAGNDAVCTGDGNDIGRGESGKDVLRGGSGNDRLSGGGQKDRLFGESGKDRLNGGSGKDRCRGGPGKDQSRKCEKGKP